MGESRPDNLPQSGATADASAARRARRVGHAEITAEILEYLEQGVVPWRKPWRGAHEAPANLVSKKAYRGINVVRLSLAGYSSRWWVTKRQAEMLGGKIPEIARPRVIVYYGWRRVDLFRGRGGDPRQLYLFHKDIPVLRAAEVYNVEQVEGTLRKLPKEQARPEFVPIEEAARIGKRFFAMRQAPSLEHGGWRACYYPSDDRIVLPPPNRFDISEEYYSTLFHEIGHSTGHASRLERAGVTDTGMFGDHNYSYEELVAEFSACFLCGEAGIAAATLKNSAAYIASWKSVLDENHTLVIRAASMAQRAADFVLGKLPESARRKPVAKSVRVRELREIPCSTLSATPPSTFGPGAVERAREIATIPTRGSERHGFSA